MVEVGWKQRYNLDIKDLDGLSVYHLAEAIAKYLAGVHTQDPDVIANLDEIKTTCEAIVMIDESD